MPRPRRWSLERSALRCGLRAALRCRWLAWVVFIYRTFARSRERAGSPAAGCGAAVRHAACVGRAGHARATPDHPPGPPMASQRRAAEPSMSAAGASARSAMGAWSGKRNAISGAAKLPCLG